jgi:fumarylpyruvate hydrolase
MGHDPNREPPFFFQKNPDNLVFGDAFPYPPRTADVHHEMEMVVALASGGKNIPVERALDCVFGYAVGLDMTRRDLQGQAKEMGRPWEVGKAFEHSAPMGPIMPVARVGHPSSGAVELKVNGKVRQSGDLNQLIWKVPEMISYLSEYFELAAGDLIMSGTPAGVAAVVRGDVMEGRVEGVGAFTVRVV